MGELNLKNRILKERKKILGRISI